MVKKPSDVVPSALVDICTADDSDLWTNVRCGYRLSVRSADGRCYEVVSEAEGVGQRSHRGRIRLGSVRLQSGLRRAS